jgi:hypothetical protein
MQKHLFEIPENVETALMTMRDDKNNIISGVVKGSPHYTESLALAFGTFVSMVQALEAIGKPESDVAGDLRQIVREAPLEEVRSRLGEIARATRKFLEEEGGF